MNQTHAKKWRINTLIIVILLTLKGIFLVRWLNSQLLDNSFAKCMISVEIMKHEKKLGNSDSNKCSLSHSRDDKVVSRFFINFLSTSDPRSFNYHPTHGYFCRRIRTSNIQGGYIFYVVEVKSRRSLTREVSRTASVFRTSFDGRKQIPKIEFYETSWIRHGVHKLGKETRFLSFRQWFCSCFLGVWSFKPTRCELLHVTLQRYCSLLFFWLRIWRMMTILYDISIVCVSSSVWLKDCVFWT